MASSTYSFMTSAEVSREQFRRFLRGEARKLRPQGVRLSTAPLHYDGQLWKPHGAAVWVAWCPDDPRFPDVHRPFGEPELEQSRLARLRELEEIQSRLGGEPPRTFFLMDVLKRHWPSRWLALKLVADFAEQWPVVVEGTRRFAPEGRKAMKRGASTPPIVISGSPARTCSTFWPPDDPSPGCPEQGVKPWLAPVGSSWSW